jgi:glycosyltransferase involved in cell wall biosynthesis/SAM-dependent methyltransferase
MNICTIIAKNYAAHARVLAESFRARHPDGTCTVLVIDGYEGFLDPAEEPFELLGIDEIGLPDPQRMAASYDVTELSTAVKPWLLRTLLARDGVETITYLDPDIWIADSIEQVAVLARQHSVVLTPHFTTPLPRDGLKPAEEDILIAGTYNLGFIALGSGRTADELLDWWSERLERHCVVDPANGLFVDQRWIDLAPGIWSGIHILRDSGYNVAYWNLARRQLERGEDGIRVDGEPLRFFHFSGFDPFQPRVLSKHQNRIEVKELPVLVELCQEHAERLLRSGHGTASNWPYGWAELPNGVRLDHAARQLFREAIDDGERIDSVFERGGAQHFVAYLTAVPEGARVSRYARGVRDSRRDLREAFPDVDGRDAAAFERWLVESADSLGISPRLLPGPRGGPSPGTPRRERDAAEKAGEAHGRFGVNLVGYLSSERGIGEVARQVDSALATRELPVARIDIPVEEPKLAAAFGVLTAADRPYDVNLVCVNADMVPAVVRAAPEQLFEGKHSAGLWFWEVESFPEHWCGSFDHLDEVWTATEFVAEALRPLAPIPVRTVRVPVVPGEAGDADRAALSMPDGFCFLFVFDFRSVFRRKNPLGLIEAFRSAFEPGEGASLLIKSVGGESCPDAVAELTAAADLHPDIQLLDGVISVEEKNAMIANCDCYVSLHRSEGLGLTMAEAMYFGRPVIATGYSGNLDFMNGENSYLVDYSLARIGEGAEPYPEFARWAEPSCAHAAEQMRAVFDDREEAARRGARGAEDIRTTHSPEAAGRVIEERLTEIRRSRVIARLGVPDSDLQGYPGGTDLVPLPAGAQLPAPAAGGHQGAPGQSLMHHLLGFEQPPAAPEAGPVRRFFKRLYLRLLRPYAAHQRRIDLSIRDTLHDLNAELVSLERRLTSANEAASELTREEVGHLDERLRALGDDVKRGSVAQAQELEVAVRTLEDLDDRLAAGLSAGAEDRTELREGVRLLESQIAALAEALGRRSAETAETLERERAFVDALRSRLDRLAQGVEGAPRGQAEGGGPAVAAIGAIKPYMADSRFDPQANPALGTVIGFDAHAGNGAAGGYRGFEDLFRGPEEMIRERQAVYVPLVSDHAPVLDAGCGRGELLDLLGAAGVEAEGVDLDPGMVARCEEKGHRVEQADLLGRLAATTPGALGCVFSAQVIEHLEAEQLQRFIDLSVRALRPGGRLIIETVNPHSPEALKAFWVDPTHRQPLFPETMLALFQLAGFASAHAFCPLGSGDWESDCLTAGEYAIVATRGPERD